MKKIFAMMAAACCVMAMSATTYTCHVKVNINGNVTEQEQVDVEVNENNGAYDLNLKNFVLIADDVPMPVGNVTVTSPHPGHCPLYRHGHQRRPVHRHEFVTGTDHQRFHLWHCTRRVL